MRRILAYSLFFGIFTVMFTALAGAEETIGAGAADPAVETPADGNATLTYSNAQPRLLFDKMLYDFGDVFRGQKVKYKFSFVNSGEGSLVIQGVHAACGCTAVEVEKGHPYKKGESGVLDITLDTTHFSGPLVKTVTVVTNEKVTPERTLTLKGHVREEVMADPPLFDFVDVISKDGASKSVKIKALNKSGVKILGLRFNKEVMEAQFSQESPEQWNLDVKLKPHLSVGFLKESIYVKTTSKSLPELPIPVRANIKGSFEIFPQYLEFGAVGPGEKTNRSFTLKSAVTPETVTGSRLVLNINGETVKDSSPYVRVSTEAQSGQKLYQIELTNIAKGSGSVHGKLILQTSDPNQKEVPVDFYAFFR